jgi:hypothetical protein
LERHFAVRANVEPRHSEHESVLNVFQLIEGWKAFDRRIKINHWA